MRACCVIEILKLFAFASDIRQVSRSRKQTAAIWQFASILEVFLYCILKTPIHTECSLLYTIFLREKNSSIASTATCAAHTELREQNEREGKRKHSYEKTKRTQQFLILDTARSRGRLKGYDRSTRFAATSKRQRTSRRTLFTPYSRVRLYAKHAPLQPIKCFLMSHKYMFAKKNHHTRKMRRHWLAPAENATDTLP